MKKLTALFLALAMVLSLAACSNTGDGEMDNKGGSGSGGNSSSQGSGGQNNDSQGGEKQDDIVLWTLSNDLKQFAERYEEQTGNHVEVVVVG